jgi:hypothetical protein
LMDPTAWTIKKYHYCPTKIFKGRPF